MNKKLTYLISILLLLISFFLFSEKQFNKFIPSKIISEDTAVPFPVDI
tara:strand:- start:982 stop:1125 length:144 start_codon:yes stop_codon:yes gene_type:complete